MGIWIRAVCTESVGALREFGLQAFLEQEDFDVLSDALDVADDDGRIAEEAREALRIDFDREGVGYLYYRRDDRFVRIERWTADAARQELDEMTAMVEDGPGTERVRDVLSRAVESVAFELKASDASAMGWPLALAAAMEIAKRGRGLVQGDTDGDTWWDPESGQVIAEY